MSARRFVGEAGWGVGGDEIIHSLRGSRAPSFAQGQEVEGSPSMWL